jgi:hypothetical protein
MRLRSGKIINANVDNLFWVNRIIKNYHNELTETHNKYLNYSSDIYWEEMTRVLIETYYILNDYFEILTEVDGKHREYVKNLTEHSHRVIKMLHHLTFEESISKENKKFLNNCINEVIEFVEKTRNL